MVGERLREIARTLRFRLTAWNAALVVVVVIATLVGVHEGVRLTLVNEFDEFLLDDLQEIRLSFKQSSAENRPKVYEMLDRKARGHIRHGWFVQLFDGRGRQQFASKNAPQIKHASPFTEDLSWVNDGRFRFVQARLEGPGAAPSFLRIGASQEFVANAVSHLSRMMLVAGGLILIVAPLGGYWLSGRATRPIARIISTTAKLHPSKLEERLPLRGTGDELDQLSRTINGMLDRIAVYLDQRRDFIANAAHELRSPLTAVRSSVEVALNCPRTTDEYVSLLTDVLEQCSGLENLVNRLLVLAEGDAGRVALLQRSVRLDQVIEKSMAMFQGVAESRGIALRSGLVVPVHVPADEFYLRQVSHNLLDNAIKFTNEGGSVEVEVGPDPSRNRAIFRVTDHGTGIPPEELPRIFERFYRGDKSRSHHNGTRGNGLGLSICRSIVTALEGEIVVESSVGQGSTFTVFLPMRERTL